MGEATRRAVLAGAAGVAAASGLAACGDNSQPADSGGGTTAGGAPPSGGTSSGGGNTAAALAQKSDIPVGGGKVFGGKDTVVTQPAAGTFKGFNATCTHQGCTVASVDGGTINCPCHGSKYSITDGSVKNGPATKGLTPKQLKIEGDSISLA
jgi:Rieske Fe-S protein